MDSARTDADSSVALFADTIPTHFGQPVTPEIAGGDSLHLCLVTEDYLPNIGGMSQHVYELARCFKALGHDVTIINQVLADGVERDETDQGLRILRRFYRGRLPKLRIIPYSLKLRQTILQEHRRNPIDVLHWHDLRAGFATTHLPQSIKTVFTNHSSSFLMGMNSRLSRAYYRLSLNHANVLLAPSQELADVTDKLLQRKTVYIPNGFDPERFYPTDSGDLRRSLKIEHDDFVLLVPRRLAPKNGVYVLAQALPEILARHPNALVVVTGGGFPDERAKIEAFAGQHHCLDRIRFLDGVENTKMPAHYNMADIVVMPSFLEAVSLAALEAMACEKCVVASDVGGLSQLFHGELWGRLVPAGEPQRLASAICTLLDDNALRRQLAVAAREHVLEHYTWASIARRTLAAYPVVNRSCHEPLPAGTP